MRFILAMVLFSLAAVVQAQPYVAMTAGIEQGTVRPQASFGIDFGSVAAEASTFRAEHVSGYGLALVGKTAGRLALVGSVGAYWLKDDSPTAGTGAPMAVADSGHKALAAVGVGISYELTKALSVRGMIERIDDYGGRGTASLMVRF